MHQAVTARPHCGSGGVARCLREELTRNTARDLLLWLLVPGALGPLSADTPRQAKGCPADDKEIRDLMFRVDDEFLKTGQARAGRACAPRGNFAWDSVRSTGVSEVSLSAERKTFPPFGMFKALWDT